MEIGSSGIWSVLDASPLYGWSGRADYSEGAVAYFEKALGIDPANPTVN